MSTSQDNLRRLARRIGLTSLLDLVGLRAPLSRRVQRFSRREERERDRIIREDYKACRPTIARISSGLPAADRARTVLVMSSFPTVAGFKLEGVFGMALRLRRFSPHLVTYNPGYWSERYHRLFGFGNTSDFGVWERRETQPEPSPEMTEFCNSNPTIKDLLALEYRHVPVGRIALSNAILENKFSRFDLGEPDTLAEVYGQLIRTQRFVHAAEKLIEQVNPRLGLVMEKGLSPWAELFGVCLARGIPVIQFCNAQNSSDFALKRFTMDNRFEHPFSLDANTWDGALRMDWSAECETALMNELDESYRSGTWFNRKFLLQNKSIKTPDQVRQQLGLDPAKKTAVIFSHVLWDATFFYGRSLFDDYETWLLQTLRAACGNPRVNWVIKLHPDLVWKLKYLNYTGELRDVLAMRSEVGTLPDHVTLVMPDTDISTFSFFAVTDYCLTVRGTIGIEMACHGVPVLTAGTGRYSNLGFTIDSESIEQYRGRLAHLEDIAPMPAPQRELARRFAHTLFKLRPWPMRSFEMFKLPMDQIGHPLDHNIVAKIDGFADFSRAEDVNRLADWVESGSPDFLCEHL